jgi:hypothetical protein
VSDFNPRLALQRWADHLCKSLDAMEEAGVVDPAWLGRAKQMRLSLARTYAELAKPNPLDVT